MHVGSYRIRTNKANQREVIAYDYHLDRHCFTWLELCQEMSLFDGLHVYHDVAVYDRRLLQLYDHYRRQGHHAPMNHREAFYWTIYRVCTDWVDRKGRQTRTVTIRRNFMNAAHKQLVRDRLNYLLTERAERRKELADVAQSRTGVAA